MNRILSWHLTLHKVDFHFQMLMALDIHTRIFKRNLSGPTPYAKRIVFAGSPASA